MAITVSPLTEADIPGAVTAIQKAFANDPYNLWVFNDRDKVSRISPRRFSYSLFFLALLFETDCLVIPLLEPIDLTMFREDRSFMASGPHPKSLMPSKQASFVIPAGL